MEIYQKKLQTGNHLHFAKKRRNTVTFKKAASCLSSPGFAGHAERLAARMT